MLYGVKIGTKAIYGRDVDVKRISNVLCVHTGRQMTNQELDYLPLNKILAVLLRDVGKCQDDFLNKIFRYDSLNNAHPFGLPAKFTCA